LRLLLAATVDGCWRLAAVANGGWSLFLIVWICLVGQQQREEQDCFCAIPMIQIAGLEIMDQTR
jgi:hypothetical protein